jgi:hypothetical protein
MKFNYFFVLLALAFAIGKSQFGGMGSGGSSDSDTSGGSTGNNQASVTESIYGTYHSSACSSNSECESCKGRIKEMVWKDAACRIKASSYVAPDSEGNTEYYGQSYKLVKATDGQSFSENLYGYPTGEYTFPPPEDRPWEILTKGPASECMPLKLYNNINGSSISLNACSQGIKSVWGDTNSISYPTSGVWQVKNEYNNQACSGNPFKYTAKNIGCAKISSSSSFYVKTVVASNGAWKSQTHKNSLCLDVPFATQFVDQQYTSGKCVTNTQYKTSIKYTLEGAAAAKASADADTSAKAEKAYDDSNAAANHHQTTTQSPNTKKDATAKTTTQSPSTGAPVGEDQLAEGAKVDFKMIITIISGIIVSIFNN